MSKRLKIEKVQKLAANLHDKKEYIIHIINLKQALNHGLVFKKVHRFIKLNQKALLKPMNTELRKKLMNNAVFGKTMENMRKYRNIKLVTNEARRSYLVSEPNYHKTNFFF